MTHRVGSESTNLHRSRSLVLAVDLRQLIFEFEQKKNLRYRPTQKTCGLAGKSERVKIGVKMLIKGFCFVGVSATGRM